MYLSTPNIAVPTPFASAPVQYADMNATVQQQQQQQQQQLYNLLNFNAANGLINSTPLANLTLTSSAPSTQTTTSINDSQSTQQQQQQQQQQTGSISPRTTTAPTSSTNGTTFSNLSSSSGQTILLENVLLREKNPNLLVDPRKTRKRLSDPVYSFQQPLQPLIFNQQQQQQQYLSPQAQQYLSNTVNLQRDASTNSLARRRSLRLTKPPIILQTIPQQSSLQNPMREPQKLLVVRHAERVDSTFGSTWFDQVFDKTTGTYRRVNLNLPKKMIVRRDLKDFLFDPPITELGLHQSKMIGEELAAQGIQIQHVYASPALRCVQTADKILEGLQMRDAIPIRIEPCLFEFLKWYPMVPIKWPFLDLDELTRNGYHVDKSYKPFYPMESLRKDEDEMMYYTRSHFIISSILKNHENEGGNLLIVGHAPTIEVCTRQLTGGQPRINELKFLVLRVPFLAMHCVAKQVDGTWKATKPPISPIKHSAVEPFDWRFFR